MKGLSIPIALLFLLIILIAILVPALIIFNQLGYYSSQGRVQGSVYLHQQEQQNNQVYRGNPNIYYNSSTSPYLLFSYNLLPTPFNITQIYYFNGTTWVPVLKQNVVISGNTNYPLPPSAFNKPVIIVTALGNIYFLNPNTSIVTVTVSGPAGKIPVYVTAFVINGSKIIPASILIKLSSPTTQIGSGLTPQIFYLNPGTYFISDINGSPIFLAGYGLTANFLNWSIAGYGSLSAPNKLSTQFTLYGPLVITAIYNASLKKFPVTIMPNGIPLGNTINNGNIYLTSLNKTIPVYVDNKLYYINSSGITLNLTYGYHIIQFPTVYNVTFNYTVKTSKQIFTMPAGQISTYAFAGLTTNTNKITVLTSSQVFVNGSGIVYGNYKVAQTYYLVVVYNNFTLPSGYIVQYNSSPILGNIAEQLLQINNTYTWGPVENYVPFKIYVKAGTKYTITYDYLNDIYGTFRLKKIGSGQPVTYQGLLSYPWYINITYIGSSITSSYYPLNGNTNPSITFQVNSPLIIINGERWLYGGVQAQ